MGKKKKKGKDKKKGKKEKKEKAPPVPTATLLDLISNYKRACKNIGAKADDAILKVFAEGTQQDAVFQQVSLGDRPLGPAGVRALADAILGLGSNMAGLTFTQIYALRLWRCRASDDGAIAMANLLKLGQNLKLHTLELVDNSIGLRGATALGGALVGANRTPLTRLNLEWNKDIGTEGCKELCAGLRTNSTLTSLNLGNCGIGPTAGQYLAEVLSYPNSKLAKLDLKCNGLSCIGLRWICISLKRNKALTDLSLYDNNIGNFPPTQEDLYAIKFLGDSLAVNTTLVTLDMDLNYFGGKETGKKTVELLKPGVKKNKGLRNFSVDYTLSRKQYNSISKHGKGSTTGKKGGGKKKKKKKK